MIPLQVTATTPHGVVLSRPWGVPLDALLSSVVWHRRKRAAREAGEPFAYRPDDIPETIELPLARCGDPDSADWHWMATFADLHPRLNDHTADPDIRWRTSRTNWARMRQLTTEISGQAHSDRSGRYQWRVIPVMAHPATTLTWRAVGDPDAIADLLADPDLRAIGKHQNVGEGVVTHWEVTARPDLAHWAAGHEHEPGILGRAAPLRCVDGHPPGCHSGPVGYATIRPPYLHPFSRIEAYHPAR